MKNILPILCVMMPLLSIGQSFNETITKEFQFEKKGKENAVMIMNIDGDIKVEGYNGDKIILEVNKQIYGKTNERLEKGKAEVQLGVVDLADTIILYVKGVSCNEFGRTNRRNFRDGRYGGWSYNWDCNNSDDRRQYSWSMDFTLKVPMGVNVAASTVNNGQVVISNIQGRVVAENVNGGIKLSTIQGATYASTINGDVDLDYIKNPSGECRFYSLNGNINAYFIKGLSANVAFESFNGNFYTNVDQLESLPAELQKKSKGDGVTYKLGGNRFKVGSGGVFLDFETFNGNVYMREKQN